MAMRGGGDPIATRGGGEPIAVVAATATAASVGARRGDGGAPGLVSGAAWIVGAAAPLTASWKEDGNTRASSPTDRAALPATATSRSPSFPNPARRGDAADEREGLDSWESDAACCSCNCDCNASVPLMFGECGVAGEACGCFDFEAVAAASMLLPRALPLKRGPPDAFADAAATPAVEETDAAAAAAEWCLDAAAPLRNAGSLNRAAGTGARRDRSIGAAAAGASSLALAAAADRELARRDMSWKEWDLAEAHKRTSGRVVRDVRLLDAHLPQLPSPQSADSPRCSLNPRAQHMQQQMASRRKPSRQGTRRERRRSEPRAKRKGAGSRRSVIRCARSLEPRI